MFRWRRRNDGFEWHEYVRTTIKLRREDRRRRIQEIGSAAVEGARGAGRRGVSAGRGAFSHLVASAGSGASAAGRALISSLRRLRVPPLAPIRSFLAATGSLIVQFAKRLNLRLLVLLLIALVAAVSAYVQYQRLGFATSTWLTIAVALALVALASAPLVRRFQWPGGARFPAFPRLERGGEGRFGERLRMRLPPLPRFQPGRAGWRISDNGPRYAMMAAGLAGVIAVGWWAWPLAGTGLLKLPSAPGLMGAGDTAPLISGSAVAVTGDMLRVGDRLIELDGIDAPELGQLCRDRRNRAWRCGRRARSTLRSIVGRQRVVCRDAVPLAGNRFRARCFAGSQDLAKEMVEQGYAFARGRLFSSYGEVESVAREAQRGVWQGDVQRPADFRAARWDVARREAPGGCPIKGHVVRQAKTYVLPWEPEYRRVRVLAERGGRWFCSEEEALTAGFEPVFAG